MPNQYNGLYTEVLISIYSDNSKLKMKVSCIAANPQEIKMSWSYFAVISTQLYKNSSPNSLCSTTELMHDLIK